MPFTFLLALGAVSTVALVFVDVDKSRKECRMYLEDEAVRVYKLAKEQAAGVAGDGQLDGVRPGAGRRATKKAA